MHLQKEFLICLLIIFFIIFVDFNLNSHFKQEKEKMDIIILKLQDSILKDEDIDEQIKELDKKWNEFNKIAVFYVEHDELEKVSLKIDLIKKNIETSQNDMTIEYLEEMKFWLDHIFEKDKLKLKNIF